jgi:hypothetical protein
MGQRARKQPKRKNVARTQQAFDFVIDHFGSIALAREEFEFEQLKERMISAENDEELG